MPAVAGVLLQWSAGLTGALLIPGFVARWALANKIARQGGQGYRGLLSVGTRTGLGLLTGLSVVLVDHVQPSYGAPLVFVLGYLLLLEPAWWLAWKHAEKAASAPGVGDTP